MQGLPGALRGSACKTLGAWYSQENLGVESDKRITYIRPTGFRLVSWQRDYTSITASSVSVSV